MGDQRLYHKVANQILELIDSGVFRQEAGFPEKEIWLKNLV